MTYRESIVQTVDEHSKTLLGISHDIHAHPETNYEERFASARLCDELESAGYRIERGIADIPTAFRATTGRGSLNVGICAEYDALEGVGHACGHNVIAAAAVGAAIALRDICEDLDLTVTVLGTPAEEGGGGKIFMLQRGAFDGLNAAMMVHPGAIERDAMATLAVSLLDVTFHGTAAHAAAAPHRGVSASAAVALAQQGIAMLREHMWDSDRVHGIVTHGGDAPNVVPHFTTARWFVRSESVERLSQLEPRVVEVLKGAATMTGCRLTVERQGPDYSDVRTDPAMAQLWRDNAATLGRNSLPAQPGDGKASTDMGNVSYAMPVIHPLLALDSDGANIHEAAFQRHAGEPTADAAVLDGAKLMAMTIADMATDEVLRKRLLERSYSVSAEGKPAYLAYDWNQTIEFDPSAQSVAKK